MSVSRGSLTRLQAQTRWRAPAVAGSSSSSSGHVSSTSFQPVSRSLYTPPNGRKSTCINQADRQRYSSIHAFFSAQGTTGQTPLRHSLSIWRETSSRFQNTKSASFSTSRKILAGDQESDRRFAKADTDSKPDSPNQHRSGSPSSSSSPDVDSQKIPETHADHSNAFENYPPSLRALAVRAISRSPLGSHSQSSSDSLNPDTSEAGPKHQDTHGSHFLLSAPQRPSKEDLLRNAKGFWTRLRIRFKWFTIRGFRRFNADDFSAFFTLGGLGTIALIIVGTTTAVSVVLWGLDLLNMQKWIARKIADYLTSQTGVVVVFESAIVPKWKDSRICFQNVFITRRANANDPESLRIEREKKRKLKLSRDRARSPRRPPASTAGMGMAWEGTSFDEYADDDEVAPPLSSTATGENLSDEEKETVNTNYTMFDLNVDSIDVTLSLSRWFDGKGLVEDAVVKGVRGIIDRRNVCWDPEKPYDPRAARRTFKTGDFELEKLEVHDLLVTIYQPQSFRPFNYSIFDATVPKLRKQWLFYDLLSADSITGQVDGCLFSLHKPQSIGRTMSRERELSKETGRWRTISRLRIDGVNIDHIQNQSGLGGPLSWIISGRFDVVADIRFPRDSADDVDINTIIAEIVDNLATAVAGTGDGVSQPSKARTGDDFGSQPIPGQHQLNGPAIEVPLTTVGPAAERAWRESVRATGLSNGTFEDMEGTSPHLDEERGDTARAKLRRLRGLITLKEKENETMSENEMERSLEASALGDPGSATTEDKEAEAAIAEKIATQAIPTPPPSVVIDLDVRFKDIKAAVPLFDSDLTYRHQAFVRPIVAFMNANRTLIPVRCRVVMDLSEFDGSMDLAQTGLLPLVSDKLYEAMANHVTSSNANSQRLKSVSIWSLKQTLHAVLKLAKQLRDTMSGVKPNEEAIGHVHQQQEHHQQSHHHLTPRQHSDGRSGEADEGEEEEEAESRHGDGVEGVPVAA
ncbi:unnamed protein product [Sympodiomycopsis kandeliae]